MYALKYGVHTEYSEFVFFLLTRWASVADVRQCIRTSQAYSTFSEPVWPLFIVCHREYLCSKIGHRYCLSLMFVDVLLLLVFETLAFIGQCCNSQLDWLTPNQAFSALIQLMHRLTTHLQVNANAKVSTVLHLHARGKHAVVPWNRKKMDASLKIDLIKCASMSVKTLSVKTRREVCFHSIEMLLEHQNDVWSKTSAEKYEMMIIWWWWRSSSSS